MSTSPHEIHWGPLITGLGGGLALFIFGMRLMTESLKTVAGDRLRGLLAKLTANRFTALLAGTLITAVVQSSSVTTVLVVGFISAGLMNLAQSIGVIIGANIGTTITAQIIAFKVSQYGLLMIMLGFLTEILSKREKIRHWGLALMGLGLIFFGMELMSQATGPLQKWPPFIEALKTYAHPLYCVVAGAMFTAIVQSSSATTGVVLILAGQGLISLESGIGLVLGSNIGTCVKVIVLALGCPREAMQAAVVHVIFNIIGALLMLGFIPYFADFIREFSPSYPQLSGTDRLAVETPRQIANAHTVFNLGCAAVFIWFVNPLAWLAQRIAPSQLKTASEVAPRYLESYYLEQPGLALDQVRLELSRLTQKVRDQVAASFAVTIRGTAEEIAELRKTDQRIGELQGHIVTYLGKLSQADLVDPQPKRLYSSLSIANYLMNISDVVATNLMMDNALNRLNKHVNISTSTQKLLEPLHREVLQALNLVLQALQHGDVDAARKAAESKSEVNRIADEATMHLTRRLVAQEPNRLAAFQLENEIVENYKRINTLTRRIGRLLSE